MSIAHQLAAVELPRFRPGHHVVELSRAEGPAGSDQCAAELSALAQIFTGRFGEAYHLSLWGVQIRGGEGEAIPEPWWELCNTVRFVQLWWTEAHWPALGMTEKAHDEPFRLVVAKTDKDPP